MTETESFTADPNPQLVPNLVDVPDLVLLDDGEYRLLVVGAKSDTSKGSAERGTSPRPFILLTCKANGYPNAETIFHKLWFPIASDEPEKRGTMLRMMKEFCKAAGLPLEGGFPATAFIGKEFNCILTKEEFAGRISNTVKRLL